MRTEHTPRVSVKLSVMRKQSTAVLANSTKVAQVIDSGSTKVRS